VIDFDLLAGYRDHIVQLNGTDLTSATRFDTLSAIANFVRMTWSHRSLIPRGIKFQVISRGFRIL